MSTNKRVLKVAIPLISVILAFFVGAVIILLIGKNPIFAYQKLFEGAFGSATSVGETLVKATPLIFTGLAAVFAYRSGMLNLGGEGQFIMGAVVASWLSTSLIGVPYTLRVIICMLASMIAGAAWGAIPGLLKAKRNVNEMIITILLNYIATYFMAFLYSGPLMEKSIPQTAKVPDGMQLYRFIPGTRAHIGFFIALLFVAFVYWYLFRSYYGFQMRTVGLNPIAALVSGFKVNRYIVLSFAIAGAIAGLGGTIELFGSSFRLQYGFGMNYGFDGVAIALIGQLHPIGTLLVAYLFSVLRCGTNTMQAATGIPSAITQIIQAIIIVFSVSGSAIAMLPNFQRLFTRKQRLGKTSGVGGM